MVWGWLASAALVVGGFLGDVDVVGVALVAAGQEDSVQHLSLPVAGLIATLDGDQVAERYTAIDRYGKEVLGCTLKAPFMTLSFLALLVIPQLKLSDLGLFDGQKFTFTEVIS